MHSNATGNALGGTGAEPPGAQLPNRPPNPTAIVPSTTDLQNLRQALKTAGFQWSGLTNAERWRYHAYDYAFLRSRGDPQDAGYALDSHGKWFHEGLVQAAESIYAKPPPPPALSTSRADTETDPDLAAHFRQQDLERSRLRLQVQVHGERRSNGAATPEMLAFMRCCARQQETNADLYIAKARKAFRAESRMTGREISEMHEALGVVATERKVPKHEDPEELRKAAAEIGIFEPLLATGVTP